MPRNDARPCFAIAIVVPCLLVCAGESRAYQRTAIQTEDAAKSQSLSADCALQEYNICSGWIWVYNDQEHAVWGTVFDPEDCPEGCSTGGAVAEILLYSRCTAPPASIDRIRIQAVDAANCPTALLYEGGPFQISECTGSDRWSSIQVPLTHVSGRPFVVQVEWGPTGSLQLASDNAIHNWECATGIFEGCAYGHRCDEWVLPPERSFIYVTDINFDGTLDDLCAIYGAPYPLSGWYGNAYPDNLLLSVVMDCESPTAVEGGSWGRVKHLFE